MIIALILGFVFVAKLGMENLLKPQSNKVNVAFVMDPMMEQRPLFTSMISSTPSLQDVVNLSIETDFNKTKQKLDQNKLDVIIDLPKDVITDIIVGQNTPVKVYYPSNLGLEELLLKDLSYSVSRMLQSSQSAIYTLAILSERYGLDDENAYLNDQFLKLVFSRQSIFTDQPEKTQTLSLQNHLSLVAYINFMLLLPVVFYRLIHQETKFLMKHLQVHGYSYLLQMVSSIVVFTLCLLVIGGALMTVLGIFDISFWFISSLLIAMISYGFFKLFDFSFAPLLYLILVIFISLFSGTIIFNYWLPAWIQEMNYWLFPRAFYTKDFTVMLLWLLFFLTITYYRVIYDD